MKKKVFSIYLEHQDSNVVNSDLLDFLNKHELSASDYHLVPISHVSSGGFSKTFGVYCIYHAVRKLD
jgi:hypothetical protein